eukprot:gb/GFBE01011328.1/.p1 GENE.gb/GFBE01011328.1/~~gb/GFBE01011328.1/.p1  ORF type:complete len:174 (+),score=41.35 gb/GFBE01011328.1/:1-522(+)
MAVKRRATRATSLVMLAAGTLLLGSSLTFVTPSATQTSDGRRDALFRALLAGAAPVVAGADSAWAKPASWSGSYNDPNHPGCERRITKDGDQFVISGTDNAEGKAACEPGDKLIKWETASIPDGDTMVIDFSSKGGPANVEATLKKKSIAFPDGNEWAKQIGGPRMYTDAIKA